MNLNTFWYPLQAPREDINGSATDQPGGEMPRNSEGAENFDDEQAILADKDESRILSGASSDGTSDEDGMTGPASSHIEASELSDDFLAGKVDLVQQMRKTYDSISDSLEGELRDGPAPETTVADDYDTKSTDEEELADAGLQLSDDDVGFVNSVRSMDEAADLGVTFDGNVVGDYLYAEKENRLTPHR